MEGSKIIKDFAKVEDKTKLMRRLFEEFTHEMDIGYLIQVAKENDTNGIYLSEVKLTPEMRTNLEESFKKGSKDRAHRTTHDRFYSVDTRKVGVVDSGYFEKDSIFKNDPYGFKGSSDSDISYLIEAVRQLENRVDLVEPRENIFKKFVMVLVAAAMATYAISKYLQL